MVVCAANGMRRSRIVEKRLYFCFLCTKKVFSQLRKIMVELLISHGQFDRYPCYISGPGNIAVVLLSMEDLRALGFNQKFLNLS